MKATKAYIASIGTTGVLLAASLLMLAVVSTVVGFRGWPSGDVVDRVENVRIDGGQPEIAVAGPGSAAAVAAAAGGTAATGAGPAAGGPGGGTPPGVAGERFTGGTPDSTTPFDGRGGNPLPGTPGVTPNVPQPPSIDIPGDPGGVRNQLADATQTATEQVGTSLGGDGGAFVTGTGRDTAEAVKSLPLPLH